MAYTYEEMRKDYLKQNTFSEAEILAQLSPISNLSATTFNSLFTVAPLFALAGSTYSLEMTVQSSGTTAFKVQVALMSG